MIKGPTAQKLMDFGVLIGYVASKINCNNLKKKDVINLSDAAVSIFETATEEPSFSTKKKTLLSEYEEAKSIKEKISRFRTDLITGKNKKYILKKAKKWYDLISGLIGNHLFSTLSEDSVLKLFPQEIKDKMDSDSRDDIDDGVWCVIYSLPTPATMILFRVVERELRRYVGETSGKPANGWNENMKKLKESDKADESITTDFGWLKGKRNKAAHPDKRYTQEEAEEILHRISGLMIAIYSEKESGRSRQHLSGGIYKGKQENPRT